MKGGRAGGRDDKERSRVRARERVWGEGNGCMSEWSRVEVEQGLCVKLAWGIKVQVQGC